MKTKKLLALLLSVAMMLSVVVAFPIESTALDGYTWYRINPNYSTDETQNYGYTHMYPAGTAGSDSIGSGYFNVNAQTYSDIKSYGYFHKAKTPHGIFYLYAENDTVLNLATSYGTNAHETNADYAMLLSVNDVDYYVGNGGSLSNNWVTDDMFTNVVLKKGVNIVRLIPTGLFTAGNSSWCDLNCLNIQNGKGVRALNHSELGEVSYGTSQAEFDALYKNGFTYSSNENCLGGAWGGTAGKYQDLTFATRNNVSNFSITVEAPRDGYYEIGARFNTGLVGNYGDIAVFVDNVKHHFAYYDFDNSMWADNTEFTGLVYMTAGTHVVTMTQGLNNFDGGYWFNYRNFILRGGLKVASTQIDPATITDNSTRIYASDYAYFNNTQLSGSNEACDSDSTKIKGTFFQSHVEDNANQPYMDMLLNGLSDNKVASFDYSIKAETNGTYTVAPRLQIGVNDASALAENGYFVILAVNDDQIYRAHLKSGSSDPTFQVKMIAGVNLVRVIVWHNDVTWVKRPNDAMWLNHEYLRVSEGLTAVAPKTRVAYIAGDLNYANYTRNSDGSLGGVGSYLGDLMSPNITGDNVTYADLSKIPHFAITLDAENSGYYNFMLDVTCATNEASGYLNVFIDQTHYKVHYYQTKQWHTSASITVYIPKGAHIMTITNVWGFTGSGVKTGTSGEIYTDWCDFVYLNINGGRIVKSTAQVDPTVTVDKYIEQYSANVMTNYQSDDPASVKTALEALLAEIQNYDGTDKSVAEWDSELSTLAASAPSVAENARKAEFENVKTAAKTAIDGYSSIYAGGASTSNTINTKKAAVDSTAYDTSKSYTENVTAIEAIKTEASTAISNELASDTAEFETLKTNAQRTINNMAVAGDSAATSKIISDGVAAVAALTYDSALGFADNRSRISTITTSTRTSVNAQRAAELAANKQAVETLKSELAIEVEASALADDTAAIEALIAATKAQVEAYVYDESKTVEENTAAVNAITASLEATLAANRKAVEDQLHVWRQYENGITAESETANVRFIFSLDTVTNDYTDYGFYITIGGVTEQYSFINSEIDALGIYTPDFFDNSDMANKIVYVYLTVGNSAFGETITVQSYFTDANGEYLSDATTANIATKFNITVG